VSAADGPRQSAGGGAFSVGRELDRLESLLQQAVPLLARSFEKIAEISAAQSRLLQQALAARRNDISGSRADDAVGEFEAMRRLAGSHDEAIRQYANAAVKALQFEDLAIQLIAHLRDRMGCVDVDGGRPLHGDPAIPRTYGPVSGDGLESGSVELLVKKQVGGQECQ